MANYTVSITLTDANDPNGPNNFNYAPGFLNVHRGDKVRFTCNQAFTVKFPHGTPFSTSSGFEMDSASTTSYATVDSAAALQSYHYMVSATDDNGVIHTDGGCPTIEVV